MWLIVGLGNPGAEYDGTRHNVGFESIAAMADKYRFPPAKAAKKAQVSKGRIDGQEAVLAQPMTFMNLSGDAVGGLARYFKIEPENIVVVHDELDFDPGVVRVKNGGGHGGHNGLRSIIDHCGRDFLRVRIGVGKPPAQRGVDHVLSRFSKAERPLVDESLVVAVQAVELLLTDGVAKAMNQINRL